MENLCVIVKVCPKHGPLTLEQVWIRKPPRTYKACRQCLKDSYAKYRLNNPEKYKQQLLKNRNAERDPNLKELRCSRCSIIKSITEFNACMLRLRSPYCISCKNSTSLRYRSTPQAIQKRKDYKKSYQSKEEALRLQKYYKISLQDYNKILEEQKYVCAICKCPESRFRNGRVHKLGVDHCHTTGTIRGLLCFNCNFSFGALKEDPLIIRSLLKYALKYNLKESK